MWLTSLEEHDVPCAPVLKRREILDHPQIIENETVIEYTHPIAGEIRQSRPAAQFSNHKELEYQGAPLLGEHSRELLETAGYTTTEIDEWQEQGIVFSQNIEERHD